MSIALTSRQQEIADYISTYSFQHGYSPTVREIGKRFGIRSPNGVMCHLKALQKKGVIHRRSFMSRAIAVKTTSGRRVVELNATTKRIRLFGFLVLPYGGEVA